MTDQHQHLSGHVRDTRGRLVSVPSPVRTPAEIGQRPASGRPPRTEPIALPEPSRSWQLVGLALGVVSVGAVAALVVGVLALAGVL